MLSLSSVRRWRDHQGLAAAVVISVPGDVAAYQLVARVSRDEEADLLRLADHEAFAVRGEAFVQEVLAFRLTTRAAGLLRGTDDANDTTLLVGLDDGVDFIQAQRRHS